MEGAAVTSLDVYPRYPLFPSTPNDVTGSSLSHPCAQTPGSDPITRSKASILTMIDVRYDYKKGNRFDLFLDFKENTPHSNSKTNRYAD
jgi:hypothetical protein